MRTTKIDGYRRQVPSGEPLEITVNWAGSTVSIVLAGEFDCAVERAVANAIDAAAAVPGTTAMVIDMTAIRFIDSSGVRCLLLARHTAHGRDMTFELATASNGPVLRLLAICGLTDLFAVVRAQPL